MLEFHKGTIFLLSLLETNRTDIQMQNYTHSMAPTSLYKHTQAGALYHCPYLGLALSRIIGQITCSIYSKCTPSTQCLGQYKYSTYHKC